MASMLLEGMKNCLFFFFSSQVHRVVGLWSCSPVVPNNRDNSHFPLFRIKSKSLHNEQFVKITQRNFVKVWLKTKLDRPILRRLKYYLEEKKTLLITPNSPAVSHLYTFSESWYSSNFDLKCWQPLKVLLKLSFFPDHSTRRHSL